MMNYPGVVDNDEEVGLKIAAAKRMKKPVDGHAPGIGGEMLRKYAAAGISTDHECSTVSEALEKISLGMKILIREGSAARNLDALKELYTSNPGQVMLCSDDLHPEMLKEGHINKLISRLVSEGYNPFDVIRSATINPSEHYNLQAGLLRQGDAADLIIVDSLENMHVLGTWIDGIKVFGESKILFSYERGEAVNKFNCSPVSESVIKVPNSAGRIRVIKALEGELLTSEYLWKSGGNECVEPDIASDILKIVVKDRYNDKLPAIGFVQGFGLKRGAFASSIAHDSHNIISIGTNDEDITAAINEIVRLRGGLSVSSQGKCNSLQLNIAGIMTTSPCDEVALQYQELTDRVRSLGCTMKAPFMTLSFMALLVIPDLKLSDRGLFDVRKFELVSLFTGE
jgi:adenine deaminase